MEVKQIVAELEREIARLRQVRSLLASEGARAGKRGRPASRVTAPRKGKKRKLTPEGRKRISDALKRRWAERRKANAKPAKAAKAAKTA